VLSYRSSGVVNFAHAAMGMYVAYAFFELRETGDLVLPVLGLPERIHLVDRPTLASAVLLTLLLGAAVGVAVYVLVFRPLRQSPALARVVASLGLLLYLQELVRLRFPVAGAAVTPRRPVLPEDPMRMAGTAVSQNRVLLVALVVVATAVLTLLYRFTRFGLATRATAGDEKGALLLGISPDRLGAVNWAMASTLAGVAVVLIEPIAGLDPTTTTLLVVPALPRRSWDGSTRSWWPRPQVWGSGCSSHSCWATRCSRTSPGSRSGSPPPGCNRPSRWR
jgi:branched-chain amino acid transport system permease protein